MVVIQVKAFASGETCPFVDHYLKTFDREAHNGLGRAAFTTDLGHAMRFTDHGQAFEFWHRIPKCRGLTIEIVTIEEVQHAAGHPSGRARH
jgi:hypothetical protein